MKLILISMQFHILWDWQARCGWNMDPHFYDWWLTIRCLYLHSVIGMQKPSQNQIAILIFKCLVSLLHWNCDFLRIANQFHIILFCSHTTIKKTDFNRDKKNWFNTHTYIYTNLICWFIEFRPTLGASGSLNSSTCNKLLLDHT